MIGLILLPLAGVTTIYSTEFSTAHAILMLKVSITENTKVCAFFFTIHPVFIGINIYLIAELDYKSPGKYHFLSLF